MPIRNCLLRNFRAGKNAIETGRIVCEVKGGFTVGGITCQPWLNRFNIGDFNLLKPCSGRSQKKTTENELQALSKRKMA